MKYLLIALILTGCIKTFEPEKKEIHDDNKIPEVDTTQTHGK